MVMNADSLTGNARGRFVLLRGALPGDRGAIRQSPMVCANRTTGTDFFRSGPPAAMLLMSIDGSAGTLKT